jgi:hypothetical protein
MVEEFTYWYDEFEAGLSKNVQVLVISCVLTGENVSRAMTLITKFIKSGAGRGFLLEAALEGLNHLALHHAVHCHLARSVCSRTFPASRPNPSWQGGIMLENAVAGGGNKRVTRHFGHARHCATKGETVAECLADAEVRQPMAAAKPKKTKGCTQEHFATPAWQAIPRPHVPRGHRAEGDAP